MSDNRQSLKYDIAFSFLAQDEGLAKELNDLLQDRFSTFLYSRQQERLAGNDGQKEFTEVFGSEARTVAVLYRHGWGESPWTRIEETAIKNRSLEESLDFATFIVLAEKTVPRWVPKTRLWFDLPRYGLKAAAAVLSQRVQELGGNAKTESVLDRAARLPRAEKLAAAKTAFQKSEQGVQNASAAYDALIGLLKQRSEQLSSAGIACKVQDWPQRFIGVIMRRIWLVLHWDCFYRNTLEEAKLRADYYINGLPTLPGVMSFGEGIAVHSLSPTYELAGFDREGWICEGQEYSNERLSDFLLKSLMDLEDRYRESG